MRIYVQFHMNGEGNPCAVTGVEGSMTDLLLPCVGDMVTHRGRDGRPCVGRVIYRMFNYSIENGTDVDGSITVTISLEPSAVN